MSLEIFPAEELGPALATQVAEDLIAALANRGRASLAVPGGTTPVFFLKALGRVALDWERVAITLTDERCVPADHPRSNQRLVRETLLSGVAGAARFLPLYDEGGPEPEETGARLAEILPLDVCVLGMGADRHIASLFPGAKGLQSALAPDAPPVLAMPGPEGGEHRITLTAPPLTTARRCYILIKGAEKRTSLAEAAGLDVEAAPVRLLLDSTPPPVIFYAD